MRAPLAALWAASILLAATAGMTLGKCDHDQSAEVCQAVTATLDPGGTLSAGGPQTVEIWVLQEDAPYPASSVVAVFARVADGEVVRAEARPSAQEAMWTATVTLPAGGSWTVSAEIDGPEGLMTRALETVTVAPLVGAAPGTSSLTAALSAPPAPGWLVVVVTAVGAGALGAGLALRRSRRTLGSGV